MSDELKSANKPEEKKVVESGLKKACKAYGIADEFVLASKVYSDRIVIVTVGGEKVTWRPGMDVKPLDPIRVDGIVRKKMKPLTGDKKAKKGEGSKFKV